MNEFIMSIPMWFIMCVVSVVVIAGVYKFVKSRRVKIGPVEFDEEDEAHEENRHPS